MLTKPLPGVQLNPIHPLSKGLVGFWLFNEGSGDIANDISGEKNHGTLKNMLPNTQGSKWQGSKFGGALDFDGVNDYINCGNDPSLDITDAITIEAWVYPTGATGNGGGWGGGIVSKMSTTTGYAYMLNYEFNANPKKFVVATSASSFLVTTNTYDYNNWYHVVGVIDGTSAKIYVNGNEDGSGSVTAISSYPDNKVLIGQALANVLTDRGFNGSIDGVKIYNRALSAEEGKQLYHDPFCNLIQVPAWQLYSPAVGGLSIPVAMHHYEALRV